MHHVLAVDIGGTKVDAALVAADGVLVRPSVTRRPTGREAGRDAIAASIRDAAAGALTHLPEGAHVLGVGVGAAGPIDRATGAVHPVNLPSARGLVIADVLAPLIRAAPLEGAPPIRLALDGTCIALAEHRWGALRGCDTAIAMIVSTGVGGGVIVHGRPVAGASGNAGHVGQMTVAARDAGNPASSTLEAVAAGPGAVAWARSQGWAGATGEDLAASFRAGDPVAIAAVDRSADAVGQAIADAATLLDLDAVAIDGGFSRVAADYIDRVRAGVERHAQHDYVRAVRVTASALGGDGPLLGAAALVLE